MNKIPGTIEARAIKIATVAVGLIFRIKLKVGHKAHLDNITFCRACILCRRANTHL